MSKTPSQGAALSSLPDELLAPILRESVKLEYVVVSEHSNVRHPKPCDSPTTTALALTCRRLHRLVTPILYSYLQIQCNGASQDQFSEIWITRHLHRTLRENPSLWTHCKRLEIEIGSHRQISRISFDREGPHNLFRIAFDFIRWLTNIEELRILGWPHYSDPWSQGHPILAPTRDDYLQLLSLASEHLTSLRQLELFTHSSATLALPVLSTAFGGLETSACFRTLDISGISRFGTRQDWELLKTRAGTASFTKLKLRNFNSSPSALQALVMWPAKLESFQFAVPLDGDGSWLEGVTAYNLGIMHSILSHQKDSLTYIRMDQLLEQGLHNFNVTEFHSLKVLWLAHNLTGTDFKSVANLLAPNLEVFHWNMMSEDGDSVQSLDTFDKREEDWLRAFAAAAIARDSTLRQIKIRFYADALILREDKTGLEYPWDRMDRIASEIQPHGIHLSYSPITVSREEFNRLARATKRYESSWWLKGLTRSDSFP
ncbi:unnamed protein product [Clonostachys rosea]|uniref:F-box domain-containing protein n=1 Tax=Bionectria ochroleuca TaxID=29856 RepID=A0ABY6TZA9_BIOOC|nr:unnamed protein product [Clonostachys rosea]